MTAPWFPTLSLGPRWRRLGDNGRGVELRYAGEDGAGIRIGVRRSAHGPLRNTYPIGGHDIELYAAKDLIPQVLTPALTELSRAAVAADPKCRRVVFAGPADDSDTAHAAEAAGFRHVVDVDTRSAELSLFVAEPDWITKADAALGQVPGS